MVIFIRLTKRWLLFILKEFETEPDYRNNDDERQQLISSKEPPPAANVMQQAQENEDDSFVASIDDFEFSYRLRGVTSERHVGIDQGVSHFAISAVDTRTGCPPRIVAAKLYEELCLPERFTAQDVVIALSDEGDLMSLMQLPNAEQPANRVDRVIVHVEQISVHNKNAKAFGMEFAMLLQRLCPDTTKCIVKMSQPNLHLRDGPAFHLGDKIVAELQLVPVSLTAPSASTVNPASRKRQSSPDDDDASSAADYRKRKQMSSDVFRYIMTADAEQMADMKIEVDHQLQVW
jgi:hypothetical protein